MTPRKAKELLAIYFGPEAVNAFDPLWPETMLGVAPGAPRSEVVDALRDRLTRLAAHAQAGDGDSALFGRALRSVAAQMIDGPGAEWSAELEAELDAPPARLDVRSATSPRPGAVRLPAGEMLPESERTFRRQARALIATAGASPQTIARLYVLAGAAGLPGQAVERFLAELVTPMERDDGPSSGSGADRAREKGAPVWRSPRLYESAPSRGGVWLAVGGVLTLGVVAFSIMVIVSISRRQPAAPGAGSPPVQPTRPVAPAEPRAQVEPAPQVHRPTAPPTADGPPDGRLFARALADALKSGVAPAARQRSFAEGVRTLRRWWPRIDAASRAASVQCLVALAVDVSSTEDGRAAVVELLREQPADMASPAAVWHGTATAGLASVLSRERELPPVVLEACRGAVAAGGASAPVPGRAGSTFDEAAVDALLSLPARMLTRAEQAASQTRAQADSWLEALRAGTGVGGSADDAARRADVAILDTVERLLTSQADASSNRSIFDFVATVLPQARFREGDPGRDRVLTWFADLRLTPADLRLITGSVATQSAASGIEPTMVLAAGATQADRDDLRARYAEAWSKAGNAASRASGGANADWHQAARAAMTAAGQATGDLEQLGAAANLARLSEVASLRFRGLPGQLPTGDAVPAAAAPSPFRVNIATAGPGAGADGEWARRYLAESRTAAARMGRIAEFEQMASPGQVDCEVLADAALTSTGETRAAAQRAVLKRAEDPNMVNAVLEALPRTRKSAGAGEFLGQFSQAGALPVTSDRWYFHFRKALVERLLTLLAFSNATVAADRVSAALAEAWNTVAGGPAGDVPEVDGPTESVAAAVRAFSALTTQVRQQVPGPTALINPDALERSHAGRVLVARGLPQAFAANQVSAVEALAVLTAAERPAAADQCRSAVAEMNAERAAVRSVAAQIRVVEAAALRLWAIRLGDPL